MKPLDDHAMIDRVNGLQQRGVVDLVYLNIVKEAVQMQPILDVMPVVHGQWTEKEVWTSESAHIDAWQSTKCSVCGLYHTTPYMYYFDNYNFCPYCGAKMDEQEGT